MTDLLLLAAILSVPASIVSLIAFPRRIAQLAGFGLAGDGDAAVAEESVLAREFTFAGESAFSREPAAA